MKEWANFFSNLIEKFDMKKLMICVFVVLALMVVPGVNVLDFLMPLDNAEKWIKGIFSLIATYLVLSLLIFLWQRIKCYFKYKPKKLFRMMRKYGEYIELFYSEEIKEYSERQVDLYMYRISQDVINKLCENKIIFCSNRGDYLNHSKYKLTKETRKKLTRVRKTLNFIESILINKNKSEDNENE